MQDRRFPILAASALKQPTFFSHTEHVTIIGEPVSRASTEDTGGSSLVLWFSDSPVLQSSCSPGPRVIGRPFVSNCTTCPVQTSYQDPTETKISTSISIMATTLGGFSAIFPQFAPTRSSRESSFSYSNPSRSEHHRAFSCLPERDEWRNAQLLRFPSAHRQP